MLVEMSITIACKCSSCGTFGFYNVSLFELFKNKERLFTCKCGNNSVSVIKDGSRILRIKSKCISCAQEHSFSMSRKEILIREPKVFYCPLSGMEQCFAGTDADVREKVDRVERELDDIINMFGYDNYFKNTQVMFDALNRLHDIAELGNLCCECGNNDVDLTLLSDSIYLKCTKCSGGKVINAASNEDLKDILLKRYIILKEDYSISAMIEKNK